MPSPRVTVPPFLFLVLIALSCGCGDYVPNHDIIVIALHPDGTGAWSRTLNYGFDDVAGDIAELPGGGFVIAAGNSSRRYESPVPELVHLADNGTVLAEYPCPALNGQFTSVIVTADGNISAGTYSGNVGLFSADGRLLSVVQTGMDHVWALAPSRDGRILAAGTSMQRYPAGSIPVYDANGTMTTRTPLASEPVETPSCHETYLEAGDRKIPVTECVAPYFLSTQAALLQIGPGGDIAWERGYRAYGLESFWSAAPAADGDGYYLSAYDWRGGANTSHRYAVRVNGTGSVAWMTDLGPAPLIYPMPFAVRNGVVQAVIPEEILETGGSYRVQPRVATFGPGGRVTDHRNLTASRIVAPTADGGFFSAGFYPGKDSYGYLDTGAYGGDEIHALKFRADGSREWEQVIRDAKADTIIRVIQRSDGGFVILAQKQNR